MSAIFLAVVGLAAFAIGYIFYSKFIAEKIYRLDPDFQTPSHAMEDGVDYVPTNKFVLWGHHFTSVAGAAPIIGPAIAVIWGWAPAFLWVVLGTIFFAGIHDFGAIWASVRNKARSIGALTDDVVGHRARSLFMIVIFLLLLMVNAVFATAIAKLFISFPSSVFPAWSAIAVALVIGYLIYRKGVGLLWPSIIGVIVLYIAIYLGDSIPISLPDGTFGLAANAQWILLLFFYAALASLLPVWLLLQPRDYINGLQLFVGLGLMYCAVIFLNPTVVAPAFNENVPDGTPPLHSAAVRDHRLRRDLRLPRAGVLGHHVQAAGQGDGRAVRRLLRGRGRGRAGAGRHHRHHRRLRHPRRMGGPLQQVRRRQPHGVRQRRRQHRPWRARPAARLLRDLADRHGGPVRRHDHGHRRPPAALHHPGMGQHLQASPR